MSLEFQFRQDLVKFIVDRYVVAFTCAEMADRYGTVLAEQAEANEWMLGKKKEFGISNEELRVALDSIERDAKAKGSAMCYSIKVFD